MFWTDCKLQNESHVLSHLIYVPQTCVVLEILLCPLQLTFYKGSHIVISLVPNAIVGVLNVLMGCVFFTNRNY